MLTKEESIVIGRNIEAILRNRGRTIRELVELSGISEPCLHNTIKAKHVPMPYTVERIAGALNMTVEELYNYDPAENAPVLSFGERLRALIFDSGLKDSEVAERIGVSEHRIRQLKNLKEPPRIDLQTRLTKVLDVTEEQLTTGAGIDDYLKTEVLNCLREYAPKVNIRVYDERMAQNVSLEELAERTGLKEATLENIEYGVVYPSYNSVRLIASALNVPCSELVVKLA